MTEVQTTIRKFSHPVYYVTCTNDSTVLVAIKPELKEGYLNWFDTVKERIMQVGEIISDTDELFSFKRADHENDPIYEFRPMTLDLYKEKVEAQLFNTTEVKTEAEMIAAFEASLENAW